MSAPSAAVAPNHREPLYVADWNEYQQSKLCERNSRGLFLPVHFRNVVQLLQPCS